MTTRTKIKPTAASLESLLQCDRDSFKALLRESLQEVLEAEMTEALGASPGERTEQRAGYRAGYYGRSLVTRLGVKGFSIFPTRGNLNFPTRLGTVVVV
jgi:transposase-like protein